MMYVNMCMYHVNSCIHVICININVRININVSHQKSIAWIDLLERLKLVI